MSALPLEPLRVSRSSLSFFYIRRRRHASDYGDADRTLYRRLEARRAEIGEDFDIRSSDAHVRGSTLLHSRHITDLAYLPIGLRVTDKERGYSSPSKRGAVLATCLAAISKSAIATACASEPSHSSSNDLRTSSGAPSMQFCIRRPANRQIARKVGESWSHWPRKARDTVGCEHDKCLAIELPE